MAPSLKTTRTARWAVPAGVIAVVAAAAGASPLIAAAQGSPSLPPKTAGELLAAVDQAYRSGTMPAMSGTVVENASLGLPSLPTRGPGSSLTSLLTGSNTARVWYGDPTHQRVALLGDASETDLIHNGQDAWQWDSERNTATHYRLAPEKAATHPETTKTATPQEAAQQLLAKVGKTTTVGVDSNGRVAGRDVYELSLAPKDAGSLIGQVRIALDGKTYVPLRVQVYPRGAATPAAQVGYTSATFAKPAAANFAFKPPAGAKVVEKKAAATGERQAKGGARRAAAGGERTIGQGWTAIQQTSVPAGGPARDHSGVSATLLKAATPVSGSWGSGRVLRTKLISALLTDDGRLYVGAVTPDALTQAAAHR